MEQILKKIMLREMNTDIIGDTNCLSHDFYNVAVWSPEQGLHDEEQCKECGVIRPLDPQDVNEVEVY